MKLTALLTAVCLSFGVAGCKDWKDYTPEQRCRVSVKALEALRDNTGGAAEKAAYQKGIDAVKKSDDCKGVTF